MSYMLKNFEKLSSYPLGKYFFSKVVCMKAPYFRTIKPQFTALSRGYCEITMKNRRAVRNHLGSVHAVAMCNLCELVAGSATDATIPSHLRWIPQEMRVEYLKIAKSDLRGTCTISNDSNFTAGKLPVKVVVKDRNGVEVVRATIDMYLSEKRAREQSGSNG